jgi:integrase
VKDENRALAKIESKILGRPGARARGELPAITIEQGSASPELVERVSQFYGAIPFLFDQWIEDQKSDHTKRTYSRAVLDFIEFMGIDWPEDGSKFLAVTSRDVSAWRKHLVVRNRANKTINSRLAALSGFYSYLRRVGTEYRIPVQMPNPADKDFVKRLDDHPKHERTSLDLGQVRTIFSMPSGDTLVDIRDTAIIKLAIRTGLRSGAIRQAQFSDWRYQGKKRCIRVREKGDKRKIVGVHTDSDKAIEAYVKAAGIDSGALFRPQSGKSKNKLLPREMSPATIHRIIKKYLVQLDDSMVAGEDGSRCIHTPHSLRSTTATVLLDQGTPLVRVQKQLNHKDPKTTMGYHVSEDDPDDSASHDFPI